ncbi:hypothetical protein RI367_004596 [Sorochytrium milnesiophthora]
MPMPRAELLRRVAPAHAVLCFLSNKIDRDLLQAAPHLRVVSTNSVGYDHIDVEACKQRGIAVAHTPDVLTDTTAETAVTLLLSVLRRVPGAVEEAKKGTWQPWTLPAEIYGRSIARQTVGIIGMGRIGEAVAKRVLPFNPSQVIYCSHSSTSSLKDENGQMLARVPFDELLRRSDIVVVSCSLNATTRHLLKRETLMLMKRDAVLINIARGGIVHTSDLVDVLREGHLWGVGLDVTDPEPLPAGHPLYADPRVVVFPHIGSYTAETRLDMARLAVDNILDCLLGDGSKARRVA